MMGRDTALSFLIRFDLLLASSVSLESAHETE